MPTLELMRGPALDDVTPDDGEALGHLAREQHARLETIREERIWSWIGGEFAGMHHLWPYYSQFVFMGLVIVTVLVAGFTQGPVLWVTAAVTGLSILPYWLLFVPARRRMLRHYHTAELRPAIVVAAPPAADDPGSRMPIVAHVLLGPVLADPARLRAQAELAGRISAALRGDGALPDAAAPFLAELRRRIDAERDDGSRLPVPADLGAEFEVAHLLLYPTWLPRQRLASRLLFVLAGAGPAPGSTTVVQSVVWGHGVNALCAALPWEAAP